MDLSNWQWLIKLLIVWAQVIGPAPSPCQELWTLNIYYIDVAGVPRDEYFDVVFDDIFMKFDTKSEVGLKRTLVKKVCVTGNEFSDNEKYIEEFPNFQWFFSEWGDNSHPLEYHLIR